MNLARYHIDALRSVAWRCALTIVLCLSASVSAEEVATGLKNNNKEAVDVVLLLDGSGSMRLTDPQRLRDDGARLITQFMKEGDRVAVVGFSDGAKVLLPLTGYVKEIEQPLGEAIQQVGDAGEYTDILAGIKTAASILEENSREEATRLIVLFSDGKMDPNPLVMPRDTATTELLLHVLPELKSKGIRIDTLAFSDQADKELLAQVALATDGDHFFTPEADKIHKTFADLFISVKKPQIVPLTSKGFRIDPDISEATFYINRENVPEVSVESPSGRKYVGSNEADGVKWYRGQKFDVVTILTPEVGSWQVNGLPPNDSFATVLTNVKLITDFPTKLNSADPVLLQAQLFESEKPIILPKMTGEVRYAYQITPTDKISEPIMREFLVDDGTNGDRRAQDGIFTAKITLEEEGEYRLRIVAQAPTFERTQQMLFRVKPRLISLSMRTAEIQEPILDSEDSKPSEPLKVEIARVELSPDAAELKKISVDALAVSKSRKRYKLPLRQSRENPLVYETFVSRLLQDGEYDLVARLSGETKKGREVSVSSQVVTYKKSSSHADAGGSEDHVEELVEQTVERKTKSKIPYYLLITGVNALVAWLLMKFLFKIEGGGQVEARRFEIPPHVFAAVGVLEERVAITEIDFGHPIFSDESIDIKIKEGGFETFGAAEGEAAKEGEASPGAGSEKDNAEAGETKEGDSSSSGGNDEAPSSEGEG